MSTATLSRMAQQAAGDGAVADRQKPAQPGNFPAMLEAYKGEIARALPAHIKADTMARIALTAFRLNPTLARCTPASVFAAVIQASQVGLRPGLMGECYLIPYKNHSTNTWECQLQMGYQGLLELVRRSGLVESVGAYLVRERDTYEVQFGTDPKIVHVPCLDGDPGPVKFGYASARMKGGGVHIEVMTLVQIETIRARSQNVIAAKRNNKKTPWDTDWDEMARKTLLRRICKFLPKSNELATALALDDAANRGIQGLNLDDAMTGNYIPPADVIDAETGEIADPQQVDAVRQGPAAQARQQQPAAAPSTRTDGPPGDDPPPPDDFVAQMQAEEQRQRGGK